MRVWLVSGASGAGKTTIVRRMRAQNRRTCEYIDLDDAGVNLTTDNIGNKYDFQKILAIAIRMQKQGIESLYFFGLASNIREIANQMKKRGAALIYITAHEDEVVARRRMRGKAFDKSLTDQQHLEDIRKCNQKLQEAGFRHIDANQYFF